MVTLNDIAAACNVSRTTVSRVLSQDPQFSVSDETRQRILAAASAMNYDMAQKRRVPKTSSEATASPAKPDLLPILRIGIMNYSLKALEYKVSGYYDRIFAGITASLRELNLASQMEFRYILKDSYEELKELDALIILGKLLLDPRHPAVAAIKYKVTVDYLASENQFDSIRPDFYQVVRLAIQHFHSIGLFDIAYIGGYDYITQFSCGRQEKTLDFRHLAFRDYCLQNGIDPDSRIWITSNYSPEEGYQITRELLEKQALPPAVLYGSDELALGSYKAYQERNIKIGEDVSIIGIDDMPFSHFLNPPLTTVSLNPSLIGSTVAYALASQIVQGRNYPLTIHPPIELVKRKSCREAP